MLPDQRAFHDDVSGTAFRLGVAEGRWQMLGVEWPFALIAIAASDGTEHLLRFNCAGFPHAAPTAGPWDRETNAILTLNRWPKGKGGRVTAVFRYDWKGATALYLPCDRVTFSGHEAWANGLPSKIWRPSAGLVQYLEQVHELLNCSDYAPAPRAAS